MRSRALGAVLALALLCVVAAVGIAVLRGGFVLPGMTSCEADVGGHQVELSSEQAENAALMAAISVERGMPARAASIAIATSYQESKLINIDHGDRDSIGLFQQRPSQGWGSEEEIMDPFYSINTFYDELEQIDGYETMRITEAAQEVQRSGYPEAYEDHAEDGRALASALTGYSPGGRFSCSVDRPDKGPNRLNDRGLTQPANAIRRDLVKVFGPLPMGGFEPGGVSTGHSEGSQHYEGKALDVFVRPVNDVNRQQGWAIAGYLVAHAERLEIDTLIFDGKIWSAGRSGSGWRDYDVDTSGADASTAAVLEHRDHVHVDVR